MTFSYIQLRKEARPLLLPWIMIMLAGVLSLFRFSRVDYSWSWSPIELLDWILPLGYILAIPLLATLPLSSEFQSGTFTMLLAQPIDRQKLWLQKVFLSAATVLPAALLYLFSLSRNHEFDHDFWLAAVWMLSATSGAVAGTLLARSAIGGLALSSAFFGTLFVFWSKLAEANRGIGQLSTAFMSTTAVVLFLYALALVSLGRRMFLRFQSIEGAHGANDLLDANHFFLPRIARDWLRCKPHGAFLNLLRREFHLLRTVWLLTLVSLVTWILLILFHFVRPNADEFSRRPIPAGLAVILSLLIALLAGSLSLGEEKNSGTHAWQLTMPVSPSAQWAVKLVVALFVGVVCAFGVPFSVLFVRGWIDNASFSYFGHEPIWPWALGALLTSLLAFWCASFMKGTVRAALWFFPVLIATGIAGDTGSWLGGQVLRRSEAVVQSSLLTLHPAWVNSFASAFFDSTGRIPTAALIILGLLLAVGLIQSHRAFRAAANEPKHNAVRGLLPPLALLLVSTFLFELSSGFVLRYWQEQSDILMETHRAIETRAATNRDDSNRLQTLSVTNLGEDQSLSPNTRQWLEKSTVFVQRTKTHEDLRPSPVLWPYESVFPAIDHEGKWVSYSATIRTQRGVTCHISFSKAGRNEGGFLRQFCE